MAFNQIIELVKARIREEKSNLPKNEIPLNASLSLNVDQNAGAPALFLETSNEHSQSLLKGQWAWAVLKSNPRTLSPASALTDGHGLCKTSGPHNPLASHCEVGK